MQEVEDLTSGPDKAKVDGMLDSFLVGGELSDGESSEVDDASGVVDVDVDDDAHRDGAVSDAQGQGNDIVASDAQG